MGNLFNNYEVKESINKTDDGSYESFKEGMIKASTIYEEKYKQLAEQFKEQSKAITDISKKKDKLIDDLIEYSAERQNIAKDIKSKFNELKRICEKLPEEDRVKFERIGLDIDLLLEDLIK